MRHQPAKTGNKAMTVLGVIVAVCFIGIAVYLCKPSTVIEYMSAVGFGIILTLGLVVLTVLDGRARSRGVRFVVDWLFGTLLLAFVHLYMIGLDLQWLFLGVGSAIIAFLSLIAALRTRFVAPEPEEEYAGEMRRRRH
jgi:hypothetical protein